MLSSKSFKNMFLCALLSLGIVGCSNAKTPLFSCPESFTVGNKSSPLNNASLFDGPAVNRAELVPEITTHTKKLNIEPDLDLYLICHYKNVKHTISLHVVGATQCIINEKPFTAQCN